MTASADDRDPVLTVAEVARRLGISVRQVQRLGIPYLDFGPRTRRYRWSDVAGWLEQRRRTAGAK